MIANLIPYSEMKDSGIEWCGEVPAHWEVTAVGRHFTIQLGKMLQTSPNDPADIEVSYLKAQHVQWFQVRTTDAPQMWASPNDRTQFGIAPGDLLVCEGGEGGRCGIVKRKVDGYIIQNALHRVRPCGQNRNDYLQYMMSAVAATNWFVALNDKTTIAHFTRWKFAALRIPIPPFEDQAAIVRFLDHADRSIRRYICAKQKLITLLEEQKQAIIHRAVTGRTDVRTGRPYPAYKPSGVGWLGDVPEHWEVRRLGRLVTLTVGFPFKSEGFTQADNDIRLLRGVNIAPGRIRWEDVVRWQATDVDTFAEYRLQVGDIVLGMDRPIIGGGTRVAVVAQADVPSLLLQRVARIRPGRELLRDFAIRLLDGNNFSEYLTLVFTGISVPHLSPDQIREFRLALPSVAEQGAIVESLASRLGPNQSVVEGALEEITRLREYRTRLIADVVTGKLDVRDGAAGLPEIDPLADEFDALTTQATETGVMELEDATELP